MSIRRGLKQHQQREEERGSSVKWLKLAPGSTARIRFLDDFTDPEDVTDTENNPGFAAWIEEHVSPHNFQRKALCTKDSEGRCWACEMAASNPRKGWARKERIYVNVLVNDGVEDPSVAVWSMSTNRSPVFDFLKDTFIDEGSISNREFRIKRNGKGVDTTYTLRDLGQDAEDFDFTQLDTFDLEKVVRSVPYAEQESFYGTGAQAEQDSEADTTAEW